MSAQNDGGPAFPTWRPTGFCKHGEPPINEPIGGMTLRDYFAAKAMHAALMTARNSGSISTVIENSAALSYQVADAMLAARDNTP